MANIYNNLIMADRTTYKIGGPAEKMVFPDTFEEVIDWLAGGEVSLVLGGGSNLLVSDAGIHGVTLNLEKTFLKENFEPQSDSRVLAQIGASVGLTKLASNAMKLGLSGLEFAHGIPGMLGGALKMNAGAHGGEMKDVVNSVTIITRDGEEKEVYGPDLGFGYRRSGFPEGCVIKEASLRLVRADREVIRKKMSISQRKRKASQPLNLPSAGSVFQNPENDYAGRLIEAVGLKGERMGQAQISPRHANFIVNLGGATSKDVYGLIRRAENQVFAEYGVRLEREIKLIGEFGEV